MGKENGVLTSASRRYRPPSSVVSHDYNTSEDVGDEGRLLKVYLASSHKTTNERLTHKTPDGNPYYLPPASLHYQ